MKQILTITALLSISFSANAQLSLFKNQDAIQTVLNDSQVISRIASSHAETQSASVSIVSTGNPLNKKFIVRVATRTSTPIGLRVCYNDINVDSEIKTVKNTSGTLTAINQLVIKKINSSVCKKPSAVASRI